MLNWFSFNTNVMKHDDSFATTCNGKLLGIKSAIEDSLIDETQHVVVVSHFAETFMQIQEMLDQHEIGYQVPVSELDRKWFENLGTRDCNVQLTFAQRLKPLSKDDSVSVTPLRLNIIVSERHPLMTEDGHIHQFCQSLPCKIQWGYLLSFEDAVLSKLLDERAIKILELFGMGENELVNSKLVSNGLRKALKKLQPKFHSRLPADSASQWLEQNLERG